MHKFHYLKHLPIHLISLTPIFKSPNHHNPYHITHYQHIIDQFPTIQHFHPL
ncbi:alpha-amylase family glycosyl hydrolase, partial [Staphylococcus aureus]|uniref:alpha-amylase family glycosyl hydrolase n=1 Tax=Staphylococcus aureus TaxID=1280 RepID=UPI0037D998A3